mgnify:CR=1 FL=1
MKKLLQLKEYLSKNNLQDVTDENYVLYVGRLEPQKDLHAALRIFKKNNYVYADLNLKILGAGSLKSELQ